MLLNRKEIWSNLTQKAKETSNSNWSRIHFHCNNCRVGNVRTRFKDSLFKFNGPSSRGRVFHVSFSKQSIQFHSFLFTIFTPLNSNGWEENKSVNISVKTYGRENYPKREINMQQFQQKRKISYVWRIEAVSYGFRSRSWKKHAGLPNSW